MLYDWLQAVGTRVIDPSYVLVALIATSAALALARRPRAAALLSIAALALIVIVSIKPVPQLLLLGPLEHRFPVWRDDGKDVRGIIILGGGLNVDLASFRPGSGLASPSGRITEAAFLARRFPRAMLLYSGGGEATSEAEQGRVLLARLGVAPERIRIETTSRTTAENARFSRELITSGPGERWLLVTSAAHMPRAVGAFRAVGFAVEAYPVDYGAHHSAVSFDLAGGLTVVRMAIKEYVGLLAYRITGRTTELFPGP